MEGTYRIIEIEDDPYFNPGGKTHHKTVCCRQVEGGTADLENDTQQLWKIVIVSKYSRYKPDTVNIIRDQEALI